MHLKEDVQKKKMVRNSEIMSVRSGPQSIVTTQQQQQQRILLHPTRHHIAQKYMLSMATWRREWAERVTYTWSAKHTDLHQHTA